MNSASIVPNATLGPTARATVEQYLNHARRYGDARTVFDTAIEAGMNAPSLARLAHGLNELDPVGYRHGRKRMRWRTFTLTDHEPIRLAAANPANRPHA